MGAPRPDTRKWRAGDRFGQLVLVDYVAPSASGDSRASFNCACGTRGKVIRLSNVTGKRQQSHCADWSRHPHPQSSGAAITANGRHRQLSERYGSASTRACLACGKVGRGNDYAYLHSSSEERTQLTGKDRGTVYSLDDEHYAVLCRRHHIAFDRAHGRVALGALSGPHVALATILGGPEARERPPALG